MNDLDKKIREALSTQDAELFEEFGGEQGIFELIGDTFRGKRRWLVVLVYVYSIVFLVLAAQYESLRDPFIILTTVPLALFGALIPMFLGQVSLNIYSQVGLITLIGLISKHGILIVEFANEFQVNEKLGPVEAVIKAASIRLRPILMTSFSTIIGILPLVVASGAGAASRQAIGITIVAGFAIGTLFTLFVLPVFYTYFARDRRLGIDEDIEVPDPVIV